MWFVEVGGVVELGGGLCVVALFVVVMVVVLVAVFVATFAVIVVAMVVATLLLNTFIDFDDEASISTAHCQHAVIEPTNMEPKRQFSIIALLSNLKKELLRNLRGVLQI